MHNPEFILEKETQKFLWHFEIQTNHLVSGRQPDLITAHPPNRETCWIVDFAVLADHRGELKESEKKDR